MRTVPRVALSLLISILLFGGIAFAAHAGLFDLLETRFYQPSVIASLQERLDAEGKAIGEWHEANQDRFAQFVKSDPVRRSLLPNQGAQDISDRTNLAGTLMAEVPGLVGIRIIDASTSSQSPEDDKGIRRVHFSTYREDILKKEDFLISYRNYGKQPDDVPFSSISMADGSSPRILADPGRDAFLYCYPFYDAYSAWRGTAVFTVSGRSAQQYLVSRNLLSISEPFTLVSAEGFSVPAVIQGMPGVGQDILAKATIERWTRGDLAAGKVVDDKESGWVLISSKSGGWGYTGMLAREDLFTFSRPFRILFLAISALTAFLVVFLVLSLKRDDMLVLRNRVRRFQTRLITDLMEKTGDVQWNEVRENLARRKHEINAEIRKGFGKKTNRKHGQEIDTLLEKSWDELLSTLGERSERRAEIPADELRRMVEQVLQSSALALNQTGVPAPAARPAQAEAATGGSGTAEAGEMEELEGLEEIPEAEPVEELEEVAEAEPVEELEEVAEAEPVEELEEVAEAEPVEELEEVAEAEPAEELEEIQQFAGENRPLHAVVAIPDDTPIPRPVVLPVPLEEIPEPEVSGLDFALLDSVSEESGDLRGQADGVAPDTILVYNFDEDTDTKRADGAQIPDITSLDITEAEEAQEVDYIDTFLFERTLPNRTYADSTPIFEFLEVIGEEPPLELIDLDAGNLTEEGSIVSHDGLFMVASARREAEEAPIDREFKELVDSVLH